MSVVVPTILLILTFICSTVPTRSFPNCSLRYFWNYEEEVSEEPKKEPEKKPKKGDIEDTIRYLIAKKLLDQSSKERIVKTNSSTTKNTSSFLNDKTAPRYDTLAGKNSTDSISETSDSSDLVTLVSPDQIKSYHKNTVFNTGLHPHHFTPQKRKELEQFNLSPFQESTPSYRYREIDQYISRFEYLLGLENEMEKLKQNNQIIEDLELRWEVSEKKTWAFFKMPDNKRDTFRFFLNKELILSCCEGEYVSWRQNVRVVSFPRFNDRNGEFQVEVKSSSNPPINSKQKFSITDVWNDLIAKRKLQALYQFGENDNIGSNIQRSILGYNPKPSVFPEETFECFNIPNLPKLNTSQIQAFQTCLLNPLSLIQGPPGTGKTVTLAAITYGLCVLYKEKILVCAPSNIAADNLAAKINLTGLKVVRVCGVSLEEQYNKPGDFPLLHRMIEEIIQLRSAKDSYLFKKSWAWNHVQDILFDNPHKIEQRILEQADVVVCTCMVAGDKRLSQFHFHTVLIDEATQSIEPECLIPINKAVCRTILAGDQKQLGPVVVSRAAEKLGLKLSLFERLVKINYSVNVLQIQFRMHPKIAQFPNRQFYNNKLTDGVTDHDRSDPKFQITCNNRRFPILFYSSSEPEAKHDSGISYYNPSEALKCEEIVTALMQAKISACNIGIITPYDAQRSYIRKYLELKTVSDFYKSVEVDSIDAFQGREKDYIIISCVRSNSNGMLGFLTDPRRLNVALTRARYGLFIIGNHKTLEKAKVWRSLINYCKENNAVVEGKLPIHRSF